MNPPSAAQSPGESPRPHDPLRPQPRTVACQCHAHAATAAPSGLSRRHFLQGLGVAGTAAGALALTVARAPGASERVPAEAPFPRGAAVRVKPVLVYDLPSPQPQTSWRSYGGIHTRVVYGDYLREVGYALRKAGPQISWQCFS